MTQVKIRLQQVDQVKDFVNLLSRYPYEIDLVSGRYTIDAKSLLGIYSLDLSNPLTLVIYSEDCGELLEQLHAILPSYNMGIKTYIQNLRCQNRENGVQDISFAAYGRKKAVSLKNTERHSCLLSKLCRCFDI